MLFRSYHRDKRISGCHFPRPKGFVGGIVNIDLAGPISTDDDGYKYILGIHDHFSGYTVAVPTKTKQHGEVARAFLENWAYRVGPPALLVSDNEFLSEVFEEVCKSLQTEHRAVPPYNARSNGNIERFYGTIKRMYRATTRGLDQKGWRKWLAPITYATNITVCSTTGHTPDRKSVV